MAKKAPIRSLSERPKFIRAIIYGNPGSGKTPFICSDERMSVLLLNADGLDAPESARAEGYDPAVWDVSSFDDLDDAYKYVRQFPDKYDMVWLDGVTLFQEYGMAQIMEEVVAKKSHRSVYLPDKPEYQLTQQRLSWWVRKMKGLPVNFGMTAHVMRVEDEDDGEVRYLPYIHGQQGALASKLCGHMGIIGRLYIAQGREGKTAPALQTRASEKFYARDRFKALGSRMINPTWAKVMDAINEGSSGGKDQVGRNRSGSRSKRRTRNT
jgi:hypothetical protein